MNLCTVEGACLFADVAVNGRLFDQKTGAGVEEDLADDVEGLLRAAGDENVVGFDDDAIARRMPGDHFAQRPIALGGAVQGLLADRRDQQPLSSREGPLRFIVPGEKRQARWVRQVTAVTIRRAE
jgi:hypothetical protein